jgi:hypothetical protein
MRLARRLRTAIRLGPANRSLLIEAAAALLAARRQADLPFRALATELGGLAAPGKPMVEPTVPLDDARIVAQVGWAVRTAAPWMPFRSLCLQQAIAARAMLARRGIGSVLHLGVGDKGGSGSTLIAHAWLDAGGLPVTGYPVDPVYAEAGRFV